MAKFEKIVNGDFNKILNIIHNAIISGSMSASFEDSSEYKDGECRFALRVYERYSYLGKNRVSMSVSLAGSNGKYKVSVITSGGSQAMFFKVNTWGEKNFLENIKKVLESL